MSSSEISTAEKFLSPLTISYLAVATAMIAMPRWINASHAGATFLCGDYFSSSRISMLIGICGLVVGWLVAIAHFLKWNAQGGVVSSPWNLLTEESAFRTMHVFLIFIFVWIYISHLASPMQRERAQCSSIIPTSAVYSSHDTGWMYTIYRIIYFILIVCIMYGTSTHKSGLIAVTLCIPLIFVINWLLGRGVGMGVDASESFKSVDPILLYTNFVKGRKTYSTDGWMFLDGFKSILRGIVLVLLLVGPAIMKPPNNIKKFSVYVFYAVFLLPFFIRLFVADNCLIERVQDDTAVQVAGDAGGFTSIECSIDKNGGLYLYAIFILIAIVIPENRNGDGMNIIYATGGALLAGVAMPLLMKFMDFDPLCGDDETLPAPETTPSETTPSETTPSETTATETTPSEKNTSP